MKTTLRNNNAIIAGSTRLFPPSVYGTSVSSSSSLAFKGSSSSAFHSSPTVASSPLLVPLKYKASELAGRAQKAYEIRTYTLNPSDYPAFLALTNEKIHMRLKHSKLLGYWITELGGVNEVVHIWEYDSLAHRQKIREALVKDKEWMEGYMAKMRPMLQKQENAVMWELPFWVFEKPKPSETTGVYSLRAYQPLDASRNAIDHRMRAVVESLNPLGAWAVEWGSVNTVMTLQRFNSLDELHSPFEGLHSVDLAYLSFENANNFFCKQSKLLLPAAWSPLK